MSVHVTPDGVAQVHIGDQYVQCAAAALVDAIRRVPTPMRGRLQLLFADMAGDPIAAEDAEEAALRDVYADLAVACAEVTAEQVRALSAAGL